MSQTALMAFTQDPFLVFKQFSLLQILEEPRLRYHDANGFPHSCNLIRNAEEQNSRSYSCSSLNSDGGGVTFTTQQTVLLSQGQKNSLFWFFLYKVEIYFSLSCCSELYRKHNMIFDSFILPELTYINTNHRRKENHSHCQSNF